jgi:hypothetical protein
VQYLKGRKANFSPGSFFLFSSSIIFHPVREPSTGTSSSYVTMVVVHLFRGHAWAAPPPPGEGGPKLVSIIRIYNNNNNKILYPIIAAAREPNENIVFSILYSDTSRARNWTGLRAKINDPGSVYVANISEYYSFSYPSSHHR